MARTLRDRLKTAAAQLAKDGHTASAEAVEAVLAPGGWTQLRQDEAPFTTNLPLTMRGSLRDALKQAADEQLKNLSAVVAEGHQAVLDGSWVPPEPVRAARGQAYAGDKRVVLNVTVDDVLRKQLRDRLASLTAELGYTRALTEGGIAIAYMRFRLGVAEDAPAE